MAEIFFSVVSREDFSVSLSVWQATHPEEMRAAPCTFPESAGCPVRARLISPQVRRTRVRCMAVLFGALCG